MSDERHSHHESEDAFEGPSTLFEPVEKLKAFRKFWKTRDAILGEEPLYTFNKKQLEDQDYMGPWQFNFFQSSLSGFPAIMIPFVVRVIRHLVTGAPPLKSDESLDRAFEIVNTFAFPFILMITAYIVGMATLRRSDSTKASRRLASRAFLYLDGAYGLYPQLAACTFFSLYVSVPEFLQGNSFSYIISIWQLIVTMKTIPALLFRAVGYENAERAVNKSATVTLFSTDLPRDGTPILQGTPPVWKYRLCILVVVPIVGLSVLGAILLVGASWSYVMSKLTG
jgi:hypothetical protein